MRSKITLYAAVAVLFLVSVAQVLAADAQDEGTLKLWEQSSLRVMGAPQEVSQIADTHGAISAASEGCTIYSIQLSGVTIDTGNLDVSSADFAAMDSAGWHNRAFGIHFTGTTLWSVADEDGTISIRRPMEKGEEFALSIAFCCTGDFEWQQAQLLVAVPIEVVVPNADVPIHRDNKDIVPLWNERLELAGTPLQIDGVRVSDAIQGPAPGSLMFKAEIRITARMAGYVELCQSDFVAVDTTGWRNRAFGIRLGEEGYPWSAPNTDSGVVRLSTRLEEGEGVSLAIGFCVQDEFDWRSCELRLAVPLDAIASHGATTIRHRPAHDKPRNQVEGVISKSRVCFGLF